MDVKTENAEPRLLLLSISLISAAAIGYEILLIRLFSITQWHLFAYMIISLALLGYGVSGTFLALTESWFEKRFAAAYLGHAAMMGLSIVGCFAIAQQVPFNALEVPWDIRQQLYLLVLYLVLFVPFFCAANCIGLSLKRYRDRIGRIYRADLLGAGGGALAVVLMLFVLPPVGYLKLLGALSFFAASLACLDRALHVSRWLSVLFLSLGIISPLAWPDHWVALRMSPYKGLSQALEVMDAAVIAEESSPLGLLTVVRSPRIPFRHAPGLSLKSLEEPPSQLGVFMDGDAMSVITRYDGNPEPLGYLDEMPSALPYHLLKRPTVLILGAGGGEDVLLARYHGAAAIDAVELNPQLVELVREKYAEFAGDLYRLKNVQVHMAEARGFVTGSRSQYDLIQLSLLDSLAASAAGTHALGESYLYTVDAFEEYLGHLKPGGMLSVTRWLNLPPRDSLKLFATAAAALRRLGVAEPGRRLSLIRSWNTTTLLVKSTDLTAMDLAALRAFCDARAFDPAYYPGMPVQEANRYNVLDEPYLFDGAMALLGQGRDDFLRRYKFYIAPATDDRPAFSHFFKWRVLPELLSLRDRGGLPLVEWGYLILCVTLLQAAVVSFSLIVLPLWTLRRIQTLRRSKLRIGFYFLALGLAFLFIEIAFIQKFTLFLSHPLYAVAVVLCAFLFFAGLGSGYSKQVVERCRGLARSPIAVAVTGIVLVALVYLFLLPPLLHRLMPLSDPAKILISIVLIAPLAFCMGMPFPLGLSWLAAETPDFIPWAWGINGCASVLSAILATILAIQFGFTAVVVLAVVLYLFAAAALHESNDGFDTPNPPLV